MRKCYSLDALGYIGATYDEAYAPSGAPGFDFPEDFDFTRQRFYKIEDGVLIEDTEKEAEEQRQKRLVAKDAEAKTASVTLAKALVQTMELTDTQKITVMSLYEDWKPGSHERGEVYDTEDGQVWECFQSYDNAVYPDIIPGSAAWYTFNRPLHGTTAETALPFVHPTGAHDIYRTGEYMTLDGSLYRATMDTAYSPTEYAAAWETVEA